MFSILLFVIWLNFTNFANEIYFNFISCMGFFDFMKKSSLSKEEILELIHIFDDLRNKLMEDAILRGNRMSLMSALMLHQVACPVFYAWEKNGFGNIADFWKEDAAIDTYMKFKANPQDGLKKDLTLYQNGMFPLRTFDKDGSIQDKMVNLIKCLLK